MFKAWLLVFIWGPSPEYLFIEKVEVPFRTMADCRLALQDRRTAYSPENNIRKFCVTNDHREGKTIDKGIPLEPSPIERTK